jgi:hypothetical protein
VPSDVDKEVDAIRALLSALEPLPPDSRRAAVEYVIKRLGIALQLSAPAPSPAQAPSQGLPASTVTPAAPQETAPATHIKTLKEQKQPKSAQEMAALVAYYLSHVAPHGERKQTVSSKDVETYFKIAEFKLPEQPRYTLPNAKKAGYLDAAGDGDYKLNPVGYNLVVHSLPRSEKSEGRRSPGRAKKRTRRSPKRSASSKK